MEGNWQGGEGRYPGRITRVHRGGEAFDILYDDGDREQEVRPASNRSRLRGARRDNVIIIMIVRRPLRPPLWHGGFTSPVTARDCAVTHSMCSQR